MQILSKEIIQDYIRNAPLLKEFHWFNLLKGTRVLILPMHDHSVQPTNIITVKRLILLYGKNKKLNNQIIGIKPGNNKPIFDISFPLRFKSIEYIRLYALMLSEGSFKTEFSLNVPEEEFHFLFRNTLKKLISENISISIDFNHHVKRSRGPSIFRCIFPFHDHLPKILFKNKQFAKEYLRIAFEAEGSPIIHVQTHKRYIKLSRNYDVSHLFPSIDVLVEGKRIYLHELKKKFSNILKKILSLPHITLLGEQILLKYFFDIDSILKLESIRLNKVDNRCGKISAKWVLYIYANNINKFINLVGFISNQKRNICNEMLKIPARRPQYFALEIMKVVSKKDVFKTVDFEHQMKKLGYVTPNKFLWDYSKNRRIIKKVSKESYKIL